MSCFGPSAADLQVEDERFVEMATAVSGTGPAYVFLVMEALIDAAVHLGFPRHIAHDLVIETLEGSTAFAKATAQHPAVLRNMVTSPGGTSAAAIHELESGRLRTVLSEAVWASYRRTVELGADLEKGLGLNEGATSDGNGSAVNDRASGRSGGDAAGGSSEAHLAAPAPKPRPAGDAAADVPATGDPGSRPAPKGLLAIFAHPDDESYGAGGVMALAAAAGNPGLGAVRHQRRPGRTAGRNGRRPLARPGDPPRRAALRLSGARDLAEPIFLGYRDSGMEGWGAPEGSLSLADPSEVVDRMVAVIRELRPAVIVTFDPGGVYGHPDHVATARPRPRPPTGGPQRGRADRVALYHQALPRSRIAAMQAAMEEERRRSGESAAPSEDDRRQQEAFDRLARPDEEITTIVRIGPVLERKIAALACHDSQMRGRRWDDPETRAQLEAMFGDETFVRVDPAPEAGETEDRLIALEWRRQ